MSNLATSEQAIAAAPALATGEDVRFRRLRFFIAFLRARPSFAVGYAITTIVIVVALFAPWLAPYGPMTADPSVYLLPPGGSHVLGTDGAGMDIFSRVVFAPRVDLAIAIIGTFLSAMIGGVIGAIVGYYEGQRAWRRAISTLVMRSADVLQAFPVFVFAIALVAVFGQSVKSIVLAIAFVNTPIYLRLMRIASAVHQQAALCRGSLRGRCIRCCDPAAPCDPQCRCATASATFGQHRLVGVVDSRTKLRRRGRGGTHVRSGAA